LCFGGNTGSAIASGSGGMPPYTYAWSNGVQGPVNANLAAGFYMVTVTDFNGCSATQTAIISQPPALAVTINSSALQLCPGAADATLTAQPV
ncbi:MAG TPA: SprB repeat-containing protein, partial [Saprospiraceae bacterium]|nr:SprB repeat-containing protein [Saprospiraceae bacterium]